MSYIGDPFRYDVCISYAHGDPKGKGDTRFKCYSQAFIRELIAELKEEQDFGAKIEVFFDDSEDHDAGLDVNVGLTPQIRDAMSQSAVFTVLMSDHYLRSNWCKDERGYWLGHKTPAPFAHGERLALARIWETSLDWPAELRDERGHPIVGTCFYDRARLPDYKWPYDWPEPSRTSRDPFRRELLSMVGAIWKQVATLKQRVEAHRKAREDAAKLQEDTGQAIYLHARDTSSKEWEAAGDALTQAGFTVFPAAPEPIHRDPVKAQEQHDTRVGIMSGCDALLLVGSQNGAAVDEDLIVVGRNDRDSARALGRRPLPSALLDTSAGEVAIPRRTQIAKMLRVDWLDCRQPPWTEKVQDWLTRKGVEAAARSL
jgi:hypothetical protein